MVAGFPRCPGELWWNTKRCVGIIRKAPEASCFWFLGFLWASRTCATPPPLLSPLSNPLPQGHLGTPRFGFAAVGCRGFETGRRDARVREIRSAPKRNPKNEENTGSRLNADTRLRMPFWLKWQSERACLEILCFPPSSSLGYPLLEEVRISLLL